MSSTDLTEAQNACEEVRRLMGDMEVPLSEIRALLNVLAMSAQQLCDSPTTEFEGNGIHALYTVMDSRAKIVWRLWSDAWDAAAKPGIERDVAQEGTNNAG